MLAELGRGRDQDRRSAGRRSDAPAAAARRRARRVRLAAQSRQAQRGPRLEGSRMPARRSIAWSRAADVVIESFRPSTAKRLGVSGEQVRAKHPRVIHCSITGYGQTGPYAELPGHDLNYVSISGMLAADRPDPTELPHIFIADIGGGAMSAVIGILAALVGRGRDGEGRSIDISMHEAALYWVMLPAARELVDGGRDAIDELPTFGRHACYNVYRTKDGQLIALGALELKFWRAFCDAVGRPDLTPRHLTDPVDQTRLLAEVRQIFLSRTRDEWLAHFRGHDVCLTPVNSPADATRAIRTSPRAGSCRRFAVAGRSAAVRQAHTRASAGRRRSGSTRKKCSASRVSRFLGAGSTNRGTLIRRPARPVDCDPSPALLWSIGVVSIDPACTHLWRTTGLPSAGRASTTFAISTSTCRATGWSSSPACPGSGKSSLAFDTIYAEGQRRYVESLSAYARQFLEQMEKPDVDLIDGLSPAISIEQKTTASNPRSTVGHGHRDLRLPAPALRQHRRAALPELRPRDLVAVARAHHRHGDALSGRRAHQRAGAGRARPQGRVQAGAGGAARARVHARADRRPVRGARRRDQARSPEEPHDRRARRSADRQGRHRAPAVGFDRPRAQARRRHRRHQHARRRRSAVLAADGVPDLRHQHSGDDAARVLVQLAARRVPAIARGSARSTTSIPARIVPDDSQSLADGAIVPWAKGDDRLDRPRCSTACSGRSASIRTCRSASCRRSCATSCCSARPADARQARDDRPHQARRGRAKAPKRSVRRRLRRRRFRTCGAVSKKGTWTDQEALEPYRALQPCPACDGDRLRPESRAVRVKGRRLADYVNLPISDVLPLFEALELTEREHLIAGRVLREIRERLRFLNDVGVGYLTLGAQRRDALGRRRAAHPARHADRIAADRRAVRARRAVDRPAPARQPPPARHALQAAQPRQHRARRRARRGDDPHGRLPDRSRAGRRRARRPRDVPGPAAAAAVDAGRVADRPVPRGQRQIDVPAARRQPTRGEIVVRGARAQQPQEHRRRVSARHVHRRHRRQRIGQVDARQRDPLSIARARPSIARPTSPGAHTRDRGHRPRRQGHPDRSVADRPHAAIESGDLHRAVHVHPRAVRDAARGARARLQGRPLLVQRQGRPLRDVPGRRRHRDRDALPAERLRDLRGMQGPPLQPRDARDQIPRQVDRRDARPDGRSGAAARRELPADRAASSARCRTSASATSSSASRRRRCRAARRSG